MFFCNEQKLTQRTNRSFAMNRSERENANMNVLFFFERFVLFFEFFAIFGTTFDPKKTFFLGFLGIFGA